MDIHRVRTDQRRRIIAAALLACCSAAYFGACSREAPPGRGIRAPLTPLNYSMHLTSQIDGDCTAGGGGCAKVTVHYPEFSPLIGLSTPDSLNQTIRVFVLGALPHSIAPDSVSALFQQFFDSHRMQQKVYPSALTWTLDRTVRVARDEAGIVTLEMGEYIFTGGAHANATLHFANFDKRTGRRLHLFDLVKAGEKENLVKVAEAIFRKERHLSPKSDFLSSGFNFKDNVFRLNDNFLPSGDTLFVHFNPYEIAAYAMGPTTLRIPAREFGGFTSFE
jgi:hypothetical protein